VRQSSSQVVREVRCFKRSDSASFSNMASNAAPAEISEVIIVAGADDSVTHSAAMTALIESRHTPKDDASISYGALAKNLDLPNCKAETYYITTAIAYTNGYPHMGHAYEFLTADVIARYHRVMGYDTFFLTGSDEHGQKVAASATAAGRTPIDHCNLYVEETARKLWCMCADAGDIYLDSYEGWYNEREEVFVPEAEAEAANFLDPGSNTPLKKVSEESYFFRMSKYCDRLTQYIEDNPSFVEPEQYRNNILARLRKDGLRDLSISRTSFSWGITMPKGFDERHVMYVWFDALSNYLTGVHGLDHDHEDSRYWPAGR
jgi:methionyl-tRNA synthetase